MFNDTFFTFSQKIINESTTNKHQTITHKTQFSCKIHPLMPANHREEQSDWKNQKRYFA